MTGFMPFDIVPTSTAEVLVTMSAVFLGLCAPPHPGSSCPRLASHASLRTRASLQSLRAASPRRYINIIIISSVTTALQQMDSKGAHEKQQLETVPRCSLHSTPLTHPSIRTSFCSQVTRYLAMKKVPADLCNQITDFFECDEQLPNPSTRFPTRAPC